MMNHNLMLLRKLYKYNSLNLFFIKKEDYATEQSETEKPSKDTQFKKEILENSPRQKNLKTILL